MCDDKNYILIDMMFDSRPIEEFESLLKSGKKGLHGGACCICVIAKKVMNPLAEMKDICLIRR